MSLRHISSRSTREVQGKREAGRGLLSGWQISSGTARQSVIWKLIVQKPKRTVVHSAPCWGENNASWTRSHLSASDPALIESVFYCLCAQGLSLWLWRPGFRSKMGDVGKETKRVAWLDAWDLNDQHPKLDLHFFLLSSPSSSFLQQTFIELLLCARQCTNPNPDVSHLSYWQLHLPSAGEGAECVCDAAVSVICCSLSTSKFFQLCL